MKGNKHACYEAYLCLCFMVRGVQQTETRTGLIYLTLASPYIIIQFK